MLPYDKKMMDAMTGPGAPHVRAVDQLLSDGTALWSGVAFRARLRLVPDRSHQDDAGLSKRSPAWRPPMTARHMRHRPTPMEAAAKADRDRCQGDRVRGKHRSQPEAVVEAAAVAKPPLAPRLRRRRRREAVTARSTKSKTAKTKTSKAKAKAPKRICRRAMADRSIRSRASDQSWLRNLAPYGHHLGRADRRPSRNPSSPRSTHKLTSIKGRCYRDDWVGQAKALLAG